MKRSLLILFTLLFAGTVYAQVPQNGQRTQTLPPPLPSRQVSGIVKDSTDTTLPGAVVKLTSPHDTISTATNADGIFIFKNVKSATFVLTVSSLGYRTQVKRLLNNDAVPRLTLDPIVLKSESQQLKEVVINGTPSITYKVDTVEYRASDYKVRPNATLDELLKKMEGFEVGSDGSVTHQGQAISKIKLNGKDYGTGDVAQGIQNLPADIIEKAQVVDDYGDQAAHTGIKSGDPQKILNVTTKADRSVGTTGRLTAQAGDHDRYNAQVFIQRINANQQIGLIGGVQNLVTGIASTGQQGGNGGTGGSPGTALVANPTLSYRDQFGPKVQINSSVGYNLNNRNSVSQSYGNTSTSKSFGTFSNNGSNHTNTNGRQFRFELDYQIDSLNYLQIQPTYSYSTTETSNNSTQDNVSNTYVLDAQGNRVLVNGVPVTTFEHRVTTGVQSTKTPNTSAGALALYVHRFRTPNRALSVQASYNWSNSQSNNDYNNDIRNYADSTRGTLVKDSLAHTLKYSTNVTNSTRLSSTYSEPLSQYGRFVFNGQVQHNDHNVNSYTDLIDANGVGHLVDTLAQRYNYATTDTRLFFNYQYQGTKVNLALGVLLEPYSLSGTKLNAAAGQNVTITQNVFQVLPVFRFSYAWSRTERIALNYTSNINEPNFSQLEPYPDLDEQKIINQIEAIKRDIWLQMIYDASPAEHVKLINHVLYSIHGFSGNITNHRDPQNSYLSQVLATKKGNQISLAIIYSIIAQKLDIPIYGVNLPQHFILAYVDESQESEFEGGILFYINAFNKGFIFGRRDVDMFLKQLNLKAEKQFYEPCSNTDIIRRILRNLISAYEQLGSADNVRELNELLAMVS